MPLVDITNPAVISFLVESYDKTARLRMKWNSHHADKVQDAATLKRKAKGYFENDVLKANMVAGLQATTRDHLAAGFNRRRKPIRDGIHVNAMADIRKGHSIVDVGLGTPDEDPRLVRPDSDLSLNPVMRPVDPREKAIIYKGIPFFGREVYLKSRNKMSPEDKYYFSECTEWDYGWRLKDSYFSKSGPTWGRVWRLSRDSKSRTGPHPDPSYYKDSDQPGPTKCIF